MSTQAPNVATVPRPSAGPRQVGLVVHPSRSIEKPLRLVREWCAAHGVEIVQIQAAYQQRQVAETGEPGDSDLIVSIGGDGTTLAALRTAAHVHRPVLGIACGSLGALAAVAVADVTEAMDRFSRGDWLSRTFPALSVARGGADPLFALNDIAVVRDGGGQVRVTAHVDGVLFARLAGDGVVVSTPIGSSGYTISAGGPLVAGDIEAFVLTPLPKHGGFVPPLVIGPGSELILDVMTGYAGARLEIDGQEVDQHVRSLALKMRREVATMVSFADQEPVVTGLRRRRIILDSPRVVADEQGR
jgi:NAD+ kinase